MSARRALIRTVRPRRTQLAAPAGPPVFWGRIGPYEAVCRHGVLYLLAPDPVHPSLRVTTGV